MGGRTVGAGQEAVAGPGRAEPAPSPGSPSTGEDRRFALAAKEGPQDATPPPAAKPRDMGAWRRRPQLHLALRTPVRPGQPWPQQDLRRPSPDRPAFGPSQAASASSSPPPSPAGSEVDDLDQFVCELHTPGSSPRAPDLHLAWALPGGPGAATSARGHEVSRTLQTLADTLELSLAARGHRLYDLMLAYYGGYAHEAQYEIDLSLRALRSCAQQRARRVPQQPLGTLAALMPLNMPLYSLTLYGLMTATQVQHVAVHLPQSKRQAFAEVYREVGAAAAQAFGGNLIAAPVGGINGEQGGLTSCCLHLPGMAKIDWTLPPLSGRAAPQQATEPKWHDHFVDRWLGADMFMVTGHHQVAQSIARRCPPETMVAYNSSGINPAIIGHPPQDPTDPEAKVPIHQALDRIAQRLVVARMLNNGQDCGAPDAIFVRPQYRDELVERIWHHLGQMGYRRDTLQATRRLNNWDNFQQVRDYVSRHSKGKPQNFALKHGGQCDHLEPTIAPAVIVQELADVRHGKLSAKALAATLGLREFYAPIFNILTYSCDEDLAVYFEHPDYSSQRMFVSVFGDEPFCSRLSADHQMLYHQTVIDWDDAEKAYGGYGAEASGYILDRRLHPQPVHPMEVVERHQQRMRGLSPGCPPTARTEAAQSAFDQLLAEVQERSTARPLWACCWQDGQEHAIGGGPANGGDPRGSAGRPRVLLREDEALGILLVADSDEDRLILDAAIKDVLRRQQSAAEAPDGSEASDHGEAKVRRPCAARHVAQAAGISPAAAHRTFVTSVRELGEVAARTGPLLDRALGREPTQHDLHDSRVLALAEALVASRRLAADAMPALLKPLVAMLSRSRDRLVQLSRRLFAEQGSKLPRVEAETGYLYKGDMSLGQVQQLALWPQSLPHDGRRQPSLAWLTPGSTPYHLAVGR